jgi:predicted Zn-dependent protease with MMP-like domain
VYETDTATIEAMVERVLEELPAEFRQRLDNLAVVVEDAPAFEDRNALAGRGGTLLGLYRGVPLTTRRSTYGMVPPDKIVVFKRALERLARDEKHLYDLVRHTVQHEIAHHFGISDARLRELGSY